MLSAVFPKAADLSSLGTQGNASQLAGLVATLLIPALLSPVAILVLAGQSLFGSPYAGAGLVAAWLMVAALLSLPLTHMAGALLAKRRENISLVAQGR
jgi:O-antigen/teichoic acid export membrane protein